MKWLNSLDELLYEVMSWLLFFPVTLRGATLHPLSTMATVESEAALPEDQQYSALLSPPLFLALALLVAHGAATALGHTDALIANQHGLAKLVDDTTSALAVRIVVFAAFPLFLAARLVRSAGKTIDRLTLRQPFYEQCYPAAIFALGLSLGTGFSTTSDHRAHLAGQVLIVSSMVYFVTVETLWFARQGSGGYLRALGNVALALLQGTLLMLLAGFLLTR